MNKSGVISIDHEAIVNRFRNYKNRDTAIAHLQQTYPAMSLAVAADIIDGKLDVVTTGPNTMELVVAKKTASE